MFDIQEEHYITRGGHPPKGNTAKLLKNEP